MFTSHDYKITLYVIGYEPISVNTSYYEIEQLKRDLDLRGDYICIENTIVPKSSISYIKYEKIEEVNE